MLSPAMSPAESPSVVTAIFGRASRPAITPLDSGETTTRGENGGLYSRKSTTIILRSRHLVLRLLGTYWSARV